MDVFLFYLLSAVAVGCGTFTVLNRNPVGSAMNLIAVMISLAGIYATLDAHFIAIIQILVYAGAIMVLFLFIVMLLNLREGSNWEWGSRRFNLPLSLAGILLVLLGIKRLASSVTGGEAAPLAKRAMMEGFGTTKLVGKALYTNYLLPFEAASVLLLAAIIGAVVLAKSRIGLEDEERK